MNTLSEKIKAAQDLVYGSIWAAEVSEKLAGITARVKIISTGGGHQALAVLGINKTTFDIIITQNDVSAPYMPAVEADIQVALYRNFFASESISETLQEVTYREFDSEQAALDYILKLATLVKEEF
jgi:hypothetical protein